MLIQKLLFPNQDICLNRNLFYRFEKSTAYLFETRDSVQIHQYGSITSDTYFNCFSTEQWNYYTRLDNLSLRLFIKGWAVVKLLNSQIVNNSVKQTVLAVYEIQSTEKEWKTFTFPRIDYTGILYFSIESLSEESILFGGGYYSDVNETSLPEIDLSIAMCTFKRESYVKKNLSLLNKAVFENERSPLYNHLKIYISDNGQTLSSSLQSNKYIKIYSNKNAGGAGGFTRAFLEILHDPESPVSSHILVMDDDIIFSPEILLRIFIFVKMLKPKYKDAFIGSSFLNIDTPWMQVEFGGIVRNGYPIAKGTNRDLNKINILLQNASINKLDYLGWWCCMIPMNFIKQELPLPLFFKRDDIEYCLRCKTEKILLNGIGVWHEPYLKKFSFSSIYYGQRNNLILDAIHSQKISEKILLRELFATIKKNLLTYRYIDAELYLNAISDYLKGIDWLKAIDPVELNKDIADMTPPVRPVREYGLEFVWNDYAKNTSFTETRIQKWKRRLSLNGYFFKAKKFIIVPIYGPIIGTFWRAKKAFFFNAFNNTGFFENKSIKRAFNILFQTLKLRKEIKIKYKKVSTEYHARFHELTSVQFWKQYLEL